MAASVASNTTTWQSQMSQVFSHNLGRILQRSYNYTMVKNGCQAELDLITVTTGLKGSDFLPVRRLHWLTASPKNEPRSVDAKSSGERIKSKV
jgi:hypothetical protein